MKNFFESLDFFLFFRFLACLLVIRQHVEFPVPGIPFGFIFGGTNSSGGYAVISFFFLSGYLHSKGFLYNKYKFDLIGILRFYFARMKRILPLYYFVTLYTIFFAFPYLVTPNQSVYFPKTLEILTLRYYGGLPYFNQVYWAITTEWLFYIFMPFLGYLLLQKTNLIISFLQVILGITLLYFRYNFGILPQSFADFLGVFVIGMAFANIAKLKSTLWIESIQSLRNSEKQPGRLIVSGLSVTFVRALSLCVATIVLMIPWVKIFDGNNWFFTTSVITLITGVFVILIEITGGSKLRNKEKANSASAEFINHLGILSFGVFLTHMLVLVQLNGILSAYLVGNLGPTKSGYIIWLLTSVITIVICNFLYYTVELPGKNKIEQVENYIFSKFKWLNLHSKNPKEMNENTL